MRQRFRWLAALWFGFWVGPASALDFQHPGGIVTAAQIERARLALAAGAEPWTGAWARLLARAERGLDEAPSPVADFHVPAYYEDESGHEAAKRRLRDDVNAAYSCALVHQIGFGLDAAAREQYGAKARALLDAWARTNRAVSGPDGRLVMAYVGTAFASSAELLGDDPAWGEAARARFTQWVETVLLDTAVIESRTNNWGSWGVLAGLAGAHWREDEAAFSRHAARLRELIDLQIDPSGILPRESGRGEKALWYTYFSLAPLTHAAEILRSTTGEDLFGWEPPSSGSLVQALDAFVAAAETSESAGAAAELTPSPSGWGGNLLFATGRLYGQARWLAWAKPPFGLSNSAWKSPDLLVPAAGGAPPLNPDPANAGVSPGIPGRPYVVY
jgi:hypothetical protein